jgi:hypothetical protein
MYEGPASAFDAARGRLWHEHPDSASAADAVDTTLVDAHFRFGREVGPHRPVRELLGKDLLGLGGANPWALHVSPDVDEAIRSLADNGVNIEIELQYANPLYQGKLQGSPRRVTLPPPGIGPGDEPPNPIFLPPETEEQIEAFLKYVRFMVNRYKGLVKHWELWNEPNIGYWRPITKTKEQLQAKARAYGKVLARFADAVHQTDPEARVISGGLASPDLVFARAALRECAPKVDTVAYHTYPGFGSNHMPEEADDFGQADGFRAQVREVPGIRKDIPFWINEWNVSPHWKNSNESVQARYLPRFYLYSHAQGVRGSMWTFIPSTDGNEDDLYGVLHGETFRPDAFQPREAYRVFAVTAALFGQTVPDPAADWRLQLRNTADSVDRRILRRYAFRDIASGKRIYAFWLAVFCTPGDNFKAVPAELVLRDAGLKNPILIDVRTGVVTPLAWKEPGVLPVPLKESVMAVADASYLDWPEVPETPAELTALRSERMVRLRWKGYGDGMSFEIQRTIDFGPWQALGKTASDKTEYSDMSDGRGHVTYRVRAVGSNGPSAWSNPAWVQLGK